MENAPSVSASELLGGNPPEKKQRPPWPSGVPLVESYPGSGLYRHPVDKAFIKRDDAIALGAPAPTAPPPTPAPAPTPTPAPQPQPEAKPDPQQTGPAPDFSDLPKSENETAPGNGQAEQPTEAELLTAYEQMGAMFWDSMIRLMAAIFGDFWLPKTADERKMVLDALTGWMKAVTFAAFTPIQNLWMAIGLYAMPRMPKTFTQILTWWKSRKNKKREPQPESRQERNGEQPHVDIDAEVMRGPTV